ncbi:MAG: preprotein translocase subunit SecA [Ruminococcaceae bacterium]|nr:preprotein translocase subunit SecA [Oscillospiraceae bacterium]
MTDNEKFISSVREYAEEYDIKTLLEKSENGKNLTPLFAAVCIAVERGLGQTPFDQQLLAGKALIEGKILEMPTGEGKTLCAVFAAVWHKLLGRRVHILTFNDYLAYRDEKWMKPVYSLLGVTVASVTERTDFYGRRDAYRADVLYISARECCFDYLRDFTAQNIEDTVGQGFSAAIVDEADSLLIDEGRIPLVVAADTDVRSDPQLFDVADLMDSFTEEDYEISLEAKNVYLSDEGAARAEKFFNVENLYDEENAELLSKINDCLNAWFMLKEDKDYICRDGIILLIDNFTGRIAENRHYPGTLQSAVELKHGVEVSTRGVIMGSIAMQYFVRKYPYLSGMTGTAEASKDEFYQLYDLEFVRIDPHTPSRRIDRETQIYYNAEAKWKGIVNAICRAHEKGQPVLAGTGSIEDSERLFDMLTAKGVHAAILNAKNDYMEADIISEAGKPYTVTISTNMAGRGVDIKLGGRNEAQREEAVRAGGLLVISTYMPESSRIVKQLIGRCGRQGDPGESMRFVSIDEPIMEKYKLTDLLPAKHKPQPTEEPIEDKVLKREVERIQRISEGDTFDARSRLLKFTMIGEKHREQIFESRNRFLREQSPNIWEGLPRYKEALKIYGERWLTDLQRKTVVAAVNRFWSEYLEYTEYIRRGIHLVEVGGKSPADEYNIAAEEYYQGMEQELRTYIEERFDDLMNYGDENYRIDVPRNIRTYLLEDTGDELNKKPFLVNFLSEESEKELLEQEAKNAASLSESMLDLDSDFEAYEESEKTKKSEYDVNRDKDKKKKGFLFWKKKK